MLRLVSSLLLLLSASADFTYLDSPTEEWRVPFLSVGPRNGVFLSPDAQLLAVVAESGHVLGLDPVSGDELWTHAPLGTNIRSKSGITFNYAGDVPYLVYAVTEESGLNDQSCRLILLDPSDGSEYMTTGHVVGECAGTPVTSEDGRHIFVTHNHNAEGHFSIFDVASADDAGIPVFFSFTNDKSPFSPIGFFHSPQEGYYDHPSNVGRGNSNDIFLWSFATDTTADPVTVGTGQIFGFQFPVGYNPDTGLDGLEVLEIGPGRSWQASTPPVITNNGRSMYWSQSRSEQRCWVGSSGDSRRRFSRANTAVTRLDRRQGGTPWAASDAPPTLSSDPVSPVVYGPGAGNQFFRYSADFSETLNVTTDSIMTSRAVVTPDDKYVFYGTMAGFLYQADGADLSTVWNSAASGAVSTSSILGDLAMHTNGVFLYVADNSGFGTGDVVAIRIADPGETPAPTLSPTTNFPSMAPSSEDEKSEVPSGAPSTEPSSSPSATPSTSPSKAPTIPTPAPTPGLAPLSRSSAGQISIAFSVLAAVLAVLVL